ncbi:MAG: MBL fold metallo-hydrolase [Deltaproteobacteria bacterium]|nr:MBL fold metallo-hydrolase [Deltaproteobacteria bacterium]MBW2571305.1 MBL fold metallo-hydrolase [Deltaproteobacteria bacterium]MBW2668589.1 MBL fold metallo-hydrolase [Deltaproteobacteria bacterium]
MIIKELVVGPLMANCFICGCSKTKEAVVIDPGGDANTILLSLADSKLKVKYIINTHGHFDHVSANGKMKDATGADILIHPLDAPMLEKLSSNAAFFGVSVENSPPCDQTLEESDTVSFGDITLKVIHTPGHTPGGISLYANGVVFVGDTLFAGSIGRTDFPGGDFNTLISSIKTKLFNMEDDVRVFSGHGPETSIGIEKRHNPFVGQF